jgi:hypothetical protein
MGPQFPCLRRKNHLPDHRAKPLKATAAIPFPNTREWQVRSTKPPCYRSRMLVRYDAIIIGTGAGGGTLAFHLARAGKKILILE